MFRLMSKVLVLVSLVSTQSVWSEELMSSHAQMEAVNPGDENLIAVAPASSDWRTHKPAARPAPAKPKPVAVDQSAVNQARIRLQRILNYIETICYASHNPGLMGAAAGERCYYQFRDIVLKNGMQRPESLALSICGSGEDSYYDFQCFMAANRMLTNPPIRIQIPYGVPGVAKFEYAYRVFQERVAYLEAEDFKAQQRFRAACSSYIQQCSRTNSCVKARIQKCVGN